MNAPYTLSSIRILLEKIGREITGTLSGSTITYKLYKNGTLSTSLALSSGTTNNLTTTSIDFTTSDTLTSTIEITGSSSTTIGSLSIILGYY